MKKTLLIAGWFTGLAAGLAAQEPVKEIRPFNGRDLSGWKTDDNERPNLWKIGRVAVNKQNPTRLEVLPVPEGEEADLIVDGKNFRNLYTGQVFGDIEVVLEVLLPGGSNSGIYLMGEYELQVADDTLINPQKPGRMDFGAIARVKAARVHAQKPAGTWQTYLVRFRAPRFDADGKKTRNAVFERVELNGILIHENTEVPDSTYGCLSGVEKPRGPLYLQGNEGPVAYRNIVIRPLGE